MLGLFRFLLAAAVVAFHLLGSLENIGQLAVVSFYVISGFLITRILNQTYKFNLRRFATNRFLRLYPGYLAMALAALVLHAVAAEAALFHTAWSQGLQPGDWWGNALIFPWAMLSDPNVDANFFGLNLFESDAFRFRLIPSSWSVGIEIVCYFLLWLVIARRTSTAIAGLAFGLIWHAGVVLAHHNLTQLYFPVQAALVPFSLGSLAYRASTYLELNNYAVVSWRNGAGFQAFTVAALTAILGINWALANAIGPYAISYVQELSVAVGLALMGAVRPHARFAVADRWLGDLSYPIFLGHYVFACIAWLLLGAPDQIRGAEVFGLGFVLTVAASAAVVKFIDQPISVIRDRVRSEQN
jgi:peptidoglycan/LPS O-acetylase OafA/YrhL